MPFNQTKLIKSFNQARDIFDVFSYKTDDTLAEVKTTGYFAQSRYLDDDPAWIGGVIQAITADGYSLLQLSNDGLSVSTISATESYSPILAKGDGVTDDTAAIQATIDSSPSGSRIDISGQHIVSRVDPGTTDYCLTINKPLHLHLMAGATIKLADADITNATDECHMLDISSSDVFIDGFGTLDMNKSGQTDTTIGPTIGARTIIHSLGGTYDNIRIKDIRVHDALGDGIKLKGADNTTGVLTNVSVDNINMTQCREGILFHWCNIVRCTSNTLVMDNSDLAQDAFEISECDDVIFADNYAEGAKGSGYDLFFAGLRCVCNDNIAKDCGSGIAIGNNTGAGGTGTDYIVKGNIIDSPQTVFGIGVYLTTGADRVIIQGNIVRNVVSSSQHAIEARAGSLISILDNTIDTTAVGGLGVFVTTGLDGTKINGNTIINTASSGIRCDSSSCFISHNKMDAETIDDRGTSNLVINNDVNTLDVASATTPIHHNNLVAGTWTA